MNVTKTLYFKYNRKTKEFEQFNYAQDVTFRLKDSEWEMQCFNFGVYTMEIFDKLIELRDKVVKEN